MALAVALAATLALLAASRTWELRLSSRNERRMRARGGHEAPGGRFPLFVALHVAWPLALVAEVALAGARPGALWPLWLIRISSGASVWYENPRSESSS